MLSFGEKIIAARAILGWSQQELADHADLSNGAIQSIEAGKSGASRTIAKITRAINRAGIVLTEDGVRKPDDTVTRMEGDLWFVDLLDDALHVLSKSKDKELLIFGGDNRISPPPVIEGFRRLRAAGVRIREMVEEGNTYLNGAEVDYRWIPSSFFKNFNTVIYGDRVLNDFHTHGILFTNKQWAEAERNKFNLIWSLLPELTIKSTADERY